MCPITITLVLLGLVALLFYVFLIWNFNYWNKRGIKTVKSYPFVGSFPSQFTQKRNVAYDVDEYYWKYKKTDNFVGVMACRSPQILILNPELVHKIFVNDFRSFHDNEFSRVINTKVDRILSNNPFVLVGEEWKERRAEVTPGLTANRTNAVYPVSLKVAKQFVDYIKQQTKLATADGLNAKKISLCYTTEVVSECVLGISAQSFTDRPTPIVENTRKVFETSWKFIAYAALLNLWPQLKNFYSVPFFNKEAEVFFFDLMKTSLQLRRETKDTNRIDFINYMIQLQEKKNLSNEDLASHTMSFLTDGFETTSATIAFILLLLGREPSAQERLREEIGTEPLSFEQLSDLPFLEACIHESLRIFPALLTGRKLVTEPFDFVNKDGTTIHLKKGDCVLIPAYSLQHDPEFYDEPEKFKPERFLEENNGGQRNYRNMGVYLGFGDGPRICPGMRFALTQVKAGLVEVLRNFNIKVNPKTRKDNYLNALNFMSELEGGIWLDFEERQ